MEGCGQVESLPNYFTFQVLYPGMCWRDHCSKRHTELTPPVYVLSPDLRSLLTVIEVGELLCELPFLDSCKVSFISCCASPYFPQNPSKREILIKS